MSEKRTFSIYGYACTGAPVYTQGFHRRREVWSSYGSFEGKEISSMTLPHGVRP
ncbi:UNVERIFIED_ORG: hypothetical protein C7429_11422 [Pantoea allii]|jgi:hypothetical protein|nr:hypothetical protein C7427_11273 [Pantoea ananatis]